MSFRGWFVLGMTTRTYAVLLSYKFVFGDVACLLIFVFCVLRDRRVRLGIPLSRIVDRLRVVRVPPATVGAEVSRSAAQAGQGQLRTRLLTKSNWTVLKETKLKTCNPNGLPASDPKRGNKSIEASLPASSEGNAMEQRSQLVPQ